MTSKLVKVVWKLPPEMSMLDSSSTVSGEARAVACSQTATLTKEPGPSIFNTEREFIRKRKMVASMMVSGASIL